MATAMRAPARACSGRALMTRSRRLVVKPVCQANAASATTTSVKKVLDVTEATFEQEVLQADRPVLVDFWATWCGPCKLMAPLMEWTEKEYGSTLKVVKIDVTKENKGLVEKYKVYGLPTLILFKNGEEIAGSKREGAVSKPLLLEYLKKHSVVEA